MTHTNQTRRQFVKGSVAAGGSVIAAMLAGCSGGGSSSTGSDAASSTGSDAGTPQQGGDLVIGLSYEPDTLNVYSTHLMGDVQAACVEGLLVPNDKMEYEPVLATEVPTIDNGGIVLSDDGKTMDITYHLREGVEWHDGEPFTSADVKCTWETLANPDWDAESKDGVSDIDSIDCPDDYTVVCHYNTVNPDFAQTLFTFGIMPQHIIEGLDMNDANNGYNSSPIGTGPYKFDEWATGEYVKLVRNEDYWRDGAYMDSVTFRFVTDENTRINMLKSGELNFSYGITYANFSQVQDIEGMDTITHGLNSWGYVDFNCATPGLDDVAVRRAIACAIDKKSIVEKVYSGVPEAWDQPWTSSDPYHVDGFKTEWQYDMDKAAKLLDDAGWEMGDDDVREKDGVRLEFRVGCRSDNTADEQLEQVLTDSLSNIGIKLNAENYAASTWTSMMYDGDYDLGIGRYITSPGPSRTVMYAIDGPLNRGKWENQDFTDLCGQIDKEFDEDKRKDLVKQALDIFDSELPQVVTYSNKEIDVYTQDLQEFVPNPTNMTNFCMMSPWWLKQD
jgi:peptide/nickel transport system substrate-binding protein